MQPSVKIINTKRKELDQVVKVVIKAKDELTDPNDYQDFNFSEFSNFNETIKSCDLVSAKRFKVSYSRLVNELMEYNKKYFELSHK